MSEAKDKALPASRRMLLVLVALFFLPLAAAFVLYYGFSWRPAGGTNHGELLQPIKQLPAGAKPLLGKWTLFYVGDGACDEDCRQTLWVARQTRVSLNKDMPRINRALFATANCCDRAFLDKEHQDLQIFDGASSAAVSDLLALLPPGDHRHDIFIADPLGNIVMRFDARSDPHGLLDDLKKLLQLSHIG
ncbi:MAG: hypothetical protein WDO12_04395 [Pseudomonadota bacterium]